MSCPPYFSCLSATLLLIAAGCDAPPTPTGTLHTDSAGIQIATAVTPLRSAGEGWTVGELLAEIGNVDGPPEYQFADVVAAVRLDNGDIVVADRGASELRSYDAEGNFRWRVGREGEGPGEFQRLDFLGRMAGDSLMTYDPILLRIQVFDPGGRLFRTFRAELPRDIGSPGGSAPDRAVGVVDDQLIVRFVELDDEATAGIARWIDYRLVAVDLTDGSATSLIVVDGEEVDLRVGDGNGYSENRYVFGNMPEFGAAAGTFAVIDTEAYQVQLVSPLDGAIERINGQADVEGLRQSAGAAGLALRPCRCAGQRLGGAVPSGRGRSGSVRRFCTRWNLARHRLAAAEACAGLYPLPFPLP